MSNCLFCKLFNKELACKIVYESKDVIGFKDINPLAKIHIVFIHKNHTENISEMSHNSSEIEVVFKSMNEYISSQSSFNDGFRIVTNQGINAGQSIFHTHFHLLGGEKLGSFGKKINN